ncbi:conjugative transposon TraM protein [Chryseobacterium vietnamense]|uniref:conjugative transposon protein TraM n=1 Tax=Chryseobacterium vietnamense TaxID=866785 RepID=UPI002858356B|nr:conjugative transposon protein TraM [Chryseobacterium vietnamense]MDR6487183.1 conjugative transposon TraM protein [Chryseobacterium vietnamense]
MKDSEKIKITENDLPQNGTGTGDHTKVNWEQLKKPMIYCLMTLLCTVCLYLIFKPKGNHKIVVEQGLNAAIPQAKEAQLQSDKQKAYEQQLLEQKTEEKRNDTTTLADYWTMESDVNQNSGSFLTTNKSVDLSRSDRNAISSYRNAQQTLGSFYKQDNQEVNDLKKEISRLKRDAVQNNSVPAGLGINDQLEFMEKSYQMAAKYLPAASKVETVPIKQKEETKLSNEKKVKLTPVKAVHPRIVSSLSRVPSDSTLISVLNHSRFFNVPIDRKKSSQSRNAIRGIVYETKTLVSGSTLSIILLEGMQLDLVEIPSGTLLTATAKFHGGRLQLKVSSIEFDDSIYPVEINIYDNDGQLGLNIPYSPEQNAVNDIIANMSQTSGTHIMMTQSSGQQIAADLSRGIVQGISGYFQKKNRQQKITVKAGHQILLM